MYTYNLIKSPELRALSSEILELCCDLIRKSVTNIHHGKWSEESKDSRRQDRRGSYMSENISTQTSLLECKNWPHSALESILVSCCSFLLCCFFFYKSSSRKQPGTSRGSREARTPVKAGDKDKAAVLGRQERSPAQGSPQRPPINRYFPCVSSYNSDECLNVNLWGLVFCKGGTEAPQIKEHSLAELRLFIKIQESLARKSLLSSFY